MFKSYISWCRIIALLGCCLLSYKLCSHWFHKHIDRSGTSFHRELSSYQFVHSLQMMVLRQVARKLRGIMTGHTRSFQIFLCSALLRCIFLRFLRSIWPVSTFPWYSHSWIFYRSAINILCLGWALKTAKTCCSIGNQWPKQLHQSGT